MSSINEGMQKKIDYFDFGFIFLQYRIDMGIVEWLKPSVNTSKFNIMTRRFPHPPYETRKKEQPTYMQGVVDRLIMLTFTLHVCLAARDIANDKETNMKAHENANYAIIPKYLSKDYGHVCLWSDIDLAVDGLTVAIPAGECFGLLGVNGAGKTTAFEMLAGNLPVTEGTAFIEGYEVTTNARQITQNVSYCGQFDSSFGYLTCRETMWMFARLRGVFPRDTAAQVSNLVSFFSMEENIDKNVVALSEGCCRKLYVMVALIGNPSVLLFDEPTVGMDPEARRKTWNVLDGCRNRGHTVVLSTHK
ncbi:ATP-binding cassette sub-family A member 3 [Lamellibrachia satsuma]|nr:ATP-binding cassette sub-family A member 3 [Lamellibrachia satsuma]